MGKVNPDKLVKIGKDLLDLQGESFDWEKFIVTKEKWRCFHIDKGFSLFFIFLMIFDCLFFSGVRQFTINNFNSPHDFEFGLYNFRYFLIWKVRISYRFRIFRIVFIILLTTIFIFILFKTVTVTMFFLLVLCLDNSLIRMKNMFYI